MTDHVLLTGATGFLGGRMAAELLDRTSATVHCLVRGRPGPGPARRLHDHVTSIARRPVEPGRLVALRGDLREPLLGLSADAYDRLAETTDALYHCGASVNLAAGDDRLALTNVSGTRTILHLAGHRRPKPVHHVSSLGIFTNARACDQPDVDETTLPRSEFTGPTGYTRTKYQAELLTRDAAADVTLYRPGVIVADSRTGACAETDLLVRVVRAAIALGVAPDSDGDIPVGPVDEVARGLIALSLEPGHTGRAFHLIDPEHLRFDDVFEHLRAFGYPLRRCTPAEWKEVLSTNLARPEALVVLALWDSVERLLATEPHYRVPRVDSRATHAELARIGATPSTTTGPELLDRMLRHLIDRRIIPAP
ncbi:thioester reductase domain-containing protein [Streptomyces sp. NPDC058486]|uniref:thioester reductase domain-containing protein n=1 Tax=unclassified Streptomyces TaxID=2593676 RepID=UPI00364A30D3